MFAVVLARAVEPSIFAAYSYLLVLGAAISVVTESGIALVAGREVARGAHGAAEVQRAGAPVVLASCILSAALVVGVGLLDAGPGTAGWPLAWTAAFVAINSWGNFQGELLRASGLPWVEAWLQVLAGVLLVAGGLLVLALDFGLAALAFALAAKQAVVVVLAQRWLPAPWAVPAPRALTRTLLTSGIWVGAAAACIGVVLRIPYLALGNAGTDQAVAEYAIASRVLEIAVMVSQTAGFGLLPALSRREAEGATSRHARCSAGRWPRRPSCACPCSPWCRSWCRRLFGDRYEGAVGATQVLVAFTPAILALYLAWYWLVAAKRERLVLVVAGLALVAAAAGALVVSGRPDPVTTALATCLPLAGAALLLSAALLRAPRPRRA